MAEFSAMTRRPTLPMSPSALPQQRLSLVVDMPPRPAGFRFGVGYGDFPEGVVPRQGVPRSPRYLVQTEWAQTPMNSGVDAFYLQARRKVWVLWTRSLDDNAYPWRWDWLAIGWCDRRGVDERAAASHLLLEYWRFQARREGRGPTRNPHDWINEEGFLSIADVRAIVRHLKDGGA